MSKVLTVATRGGRLAVVQTEIVISALKKIYPDTKIRITKITTKGDRDRRTVLWKLRTTGFFTSQVEDALLSGEADFAVHSFKDLPTREREGLTIAAVCARQFAEDCLISADSVGSIEQLRRSAKVGTSSLRRIAQLRRLRPDIEPASIRGNVLTRIRLLEACPECNRREDKFDAIILARAGIERLGLGGKISICFDPRQFIPAPAQGALAVQTKTSDVATGKLLAALNDEETRSITFAERQVLSMLQCGCHAPVGAFAQIAGDDMEIHAFISDLEGKNFISRQISGPADDADKLADKIANELLNAGGRKILQSLKNT